MLFFSYLAFAGVLQGIFFGLILFIAPTNNRQANKVLGNLLIFISLSIAGDVATWIFPMETVKSVFPFIDVLPAFILLFGPTMLLYVNITIGSELNSFKKLYSHFIPFTAAFIIRFILILLQTLDIPAPGEISSIIIMILSTAKFIHVFLYFFHFLGRLKKHEQNVKESFSSLQKKDLSWLRFVIFMFISVFLLLLILGIFIIITRSVELQSYGERTAAIIVSLCLFILGFKGFTQPSLFTQRQEDNRKNEKYAYSSLHENDKGHFVQKLTSIIEEKRPFLDNELTITTLAEISGIPANHLSQIMNEKLERNFYDYINEFRVKEVIQMLKSGKDKDFTILSLAFEAGFNSKTAFYAAFKKFTGLTPSQFKKTISLE